MALFLNDLKEQETRKENTQTNDAQNLASQQLIDLIDQDDSLDGSDGAASIMPTDEVTKLSMSGRVTDPSLELLDPNPNIWHLFQIFDHRFFSGLLSSNAVAVKWSPNMTRTAGLCSWNPRSGFVEIRLSQPLHRLRPRSDLVQTLIHEMIHAVLFVNREDDNHESHGTIFHSHMHRINREAGCNITVFHNFIDEVRYYQKHVWKCNGPCASRAPYYGILRRAVNRPPGPSDYWFKKHQFECGGQYIKISDNGLGEFAANNQVSSLNDSKSEGKKKEKSNEKSPDRKGIADIRSYFTPVSSSENKPTSTFVPSHHASNSTPTVSASSSSPVKLDIPEDNCNAVSTSKLGAFSSKSSGSVSSSSSGSYSSSKSTFVPFSGEGRVLGFGEINNDRNTVSTGTTRGNQNNSISTISSIPVPSSSISSTVARGLTRTTIVEVIDLDE